MKEEESVEQEEVKPIDQLEGAETLLERITAVTERQERATLAMKEQLDRQERLKIQSMLGGESETNGTPKEDSPEEYAAKALRGELDVKEE